MTGNDEEEEHPEEGEHEGDNLENEDPNAQGEPPKKRSKFDFTKYQDKETTGPKVDSELADIVNGLFSEGVQEDKFKKLVQEIKRPDNCASVTPVKINELVWGLLTAQVKTRENKFQHIQTSIAKAGACLTHMVDAISKDDNWWVTAHLGR